jgi:2-dehydropantoate 2-reductase
MRILVLGAGAIGGYFGGRLAEAGADVTFLVRPRRAEQLATDGLVVRSKLGDIQRSVRTVTADRLSDDGRFDLVLLTCKAYDLEAAITAIAPAVRNGAAVLPMLNGMLHLDRLDAVFGQDRVLGGLCQIGATMTEAGEIRHLNPAHVMIFGPRVATQAALVEAFAASAKPANFDARAVDNVLQDMWEKFVLLTTMAGMTCTMRGPVGDIMTADEGEALTLELLAENAAVATAAGYAPRPDRQARARATLTERGSSFAASMLRDVERGGPTEAAHVVGDMLTRSRAAGLAAPMLRVAWCHLQVNDARRKRERAAAS